MKYYSIQELSRSSAAIKLDVDNALDKESQKTLSCSWLSPTLKRFFVVPYER